MKYKISAVIIAAFAAGAASADMLPEGLSLRVTAGGSAPMAADVTDRDFAGGGLISGDANDLTAGKLDHIRESPLVGIGADYALFGGLRVGAAVQYRTNFELKDHDGHPANPLFDDPGALSSAKGGISALTYMATAAYDLPVALGPFRPYVSAGVGGATVKTDTLHVVYYGLGSDLQGQSKSQFAYTIGAGIRCELTSDVALELGYQYADLGDITYPAQTFTNAGIPLPSSGMKGKLKTNEGLVTLSVHF